MNDGIPDKPPLVLFHGITSSGPAAWKGTSPWLVGHHRVFTPTALGHRGGRPAGRRPVTIWDVVDDAERYLDEHGLQRPHVAGNSMGGFVAVELGRRGRAASVCALSPGGFWSPLDGLRDKVIGGIRRDAAITRVVGPVVKIALGSAGVRRLMMRGVARHPERLSAADAREGVDNTAACTVVDDLFGTDDQQVAPLDPLPCPVTVAWAECDAMLPASICEPLVRQRIPGAEFKVLPGVGHVPMIDDPELVARTILAVTTAPAAR